MAVVPSPGVRGVTVAESPIRDLGRESEWCDPWGVKLNASKTKSIIVSRSRTMHPQSPINYWRNCTEGDLVILGVIFGSKMTFEKHLRTVSRAASQRLVILSKSWRVFHDWSLLGKCFCVFVLPVLEYCSAVWCSAADTHLKLLDRAVSDARFLTGGVFECDHNFSINGTIVLTPYSMVSDWRVSRAGPMLFYWPKLLYLYYSLLLFFRFSSFCQ